MLVEEPRQQARSVVGHDRDRRGRRVEGQLRPAGVVVRGRRAHELSPNVRRHASSDVSSGCGCAVAARRAGATRGAGAGAGARCRRACGGYLRPIADVDVLSGAVGRADERAVVQRQAPPVRVVLAEFDFGLGEVLGPRGVEPVRDERDGGEPAQSQPRRVVELVLRTTLEHRRAPARPERDARVLVHDASRGNPSRGRAPRAWPSRDSRACAPGPDRMSRSARWRSATG